jgi:hypothetical protein
VTGVVDVGAVAGRLSTGGSVFMGRMALRNAMATAGGSVLMSLMIVPGAVPTDLGVRDHGSRFRCVTLCMVMIHVVAGMHDLLHITCGRRVSGMRVHMARVAGKDIASAAIGSR